MSRRCWPAANVLVDGGYCMYVPRTLGTLGIPNGLKRLARYVPVQIYISSHGKQHVALGDEALLGGISFSTCVHMRAMNLGLGPSTQRNTGSIYCGN